MTPNNLRCIVECPRCWAVVKVTQHSDSECDEYLARKVGARLRGSDWMAQRFNFNQFRSRMNQAAKEGEEKKRHGP